MSHVEAVVSSPIGVQPLRAVPDGRSANSSIQAEIVWRRTLELAESFDQNHLFAVVLELLRVSHYELVTMVDAQMLGRTRMGTHPIDLVARRASGLLQRAIAFLGGANSSGRGRLGRCSTMSKEALA